LAKYVSDTRTCHKGRQSKGDGKEKEGKEEGMVA